MKLIITLLAAALPLLAAAQTQTVWRCGVDGRSYSDAPCSGGTQLAVADPRPQADVDSAQALALREQRLAEQLRQERAKREVQPVVRLLKAPRPAAAKQSDLPAHQKKHAKRRHAEPDTWQAVAPASRRTKG